MPCTPGFLADQDECRQIAPADESPAQGDPRVQGAAGLGGAGGARTHDRRIMSPARQQAALRQLTWAGTDERDAVRADFGTHWA